jgi:hypothetical protein
MKYCIHRILFKDGVVDFGDVMDQVVLAMALEHIFGTIYLWVLGLRYLRLRELEDSLPIKTLTIELFV